MDYFGIDLAWKDSNPSGIAHLVDGVNKPRLVQCMRLIGYRRIADSIDPKGPAILGIDAPLVVPNERGSRPVDLLVSRVYRKQRLSAYPANQRLLARGGMCGVQLLKRLNKQGYITGLEPSRGGRNVIEVYPHATILFLDPALRKPLRYKTRFRVAERRIGLQRLLDLLAKRIDLAGFFPPEIGHLRGRQLKDAEDQLDAVVCAFSAYMASRFRERCRMLGDLTLGFMIAPMVPAILKELDAGAHRI